MSKKKPIFVERDCIRYEIVKVKPEFCTSHCAFARLERKNDTHLCERECHVPKWARNLIRDDECLEEVL